MAGLRGRPTHLDPPATNPILVGRTVKQQRPDIVHKFLAGVPSPRHSRRCSGDHTEVEEAADALRLSRSVKADEGRPSAGVKRDCIEWPGPASMTDQGIRAPGSPSFSRWRGG